MKNFTLVIAIGVFLLLMSNCKKTNNPNSIDCINSSFSRTFDIKIIPSYIEVDNKGNIILLGNNKETIKVVRLNPDGELLWQKEYPQLLGKENGIVYIDENSFFIKTSTNHYEFELSPIYYENVWIKNSNMLADDNNYIPTYEITGLIQPKLQLENTNITYLSKISSDGEILWTNEFNGDACNGDSFYRIDQNNFLFLTSEYYGPYFELIIHDGHMDTINHPNDRNKRTVYKINDDGDIIWNTEINNIFNVSWDYYPYPAYEQSITLNQNRIIVNTLNNTYELSLSGELTSSFQPEYNFQGNWTYFMVGASETENYFFGDPHTHTNYNIDNYLMKYNVETHQTIWQKRQLSFPIHISSYPNKGLLMMDYNSIIEKFDNTGESVWQREIPSTTWNLGSCIKATCDGGVIFAQTSNTLDKLFIIKLDEFGEY